jgi:3-methyladenine DNA glycosylase Tag
MTGAMGPGGFDPSKADPAMMAQMTKALQRLPRGQLMKLQSIMQRAQAGQDVSREAGEFERMLPPEFSQMAMQMMMAQGMGGGAAPDMNTDEAKQIVAKAVAEGKMTEAQAKELLGGEDPAAILAASEKKGISGFFKKITGK